MNDVAYLERGTMIVVGTLISVSHSLAVGLYEVTQLKKVSGDGGFIFNVKPIKMEKGEVELFFGRYELEDMMEQKMVKIYNQSY